MAEFNWSEGGKGALGGAATGAAIGSVGGPWGAAIGGVIGGVGGGISAGFSGGESEQELNNRRLMEEYYRQIQNRPIDRAGPAAQGQYSDFRSNQAGLISRLEAMANGQGPSLAKQQFEQATDRNMRGQQAMAASGRGGPLSQLTAANNMGMLGASAAQGSAIARTGEQMGAISQLGGVINQGRTSDESMNQFNAGQKNNLSLANLNARLTQMGMSDQARLALLGKSADINMSQYGRVSTGDQLLAGGAGAFSQMATQQAQQRAAQQQTTQSQAPQWSVPQNHTMNPYQGQSNVDLFNYNRSTIGQGGKGY